MSYKIETKVLTSLAVLSSRFMNLPANFSPVGGFGFFGKSTGLFFLSIIVFDIFKSGLYAGFWLTYLGFAMYPLLGRLARGTVKRQVLLLPAASLLFFIISNLGVWWYWRDHSVQSLVSTYALGLPFYRNTLLGDLVFGYGFLAAKELVARKQTVLELLVALRERVRTHTNVLIH